MNADCQLYCCCYLFVFVIGFFQSGKNIKPLNLFDVKYLFSFLKKKKKELSGAYNVQDRRVSYRENKLRQKVCLQ